MITREGLKSFYNMLNTTQC